MSFWSDREAVVMARQDWWALVWIMGVHGVLWGWAGPVLEASDDLAYILYAHQLQQGGFFFDETLYAHRMGVFAPAAFFYDLFGVNLRTAALWPLLCSLATIGALYRVVLFMAGRAAAALSAWMLATNPFWLQQTLYLGADLVMAAGTFVALAALAEARHSGRDDSARMGGIVAGCGLSLAVITKLTAYWPMMFVIAVLLLDLVRGANRRMWGWFVATGLFIGLFYLGIYLWVRGDPLYHVHLVSRIVNQPTGYWGFHPDSGNSLSARLTYQPLLMLLQNPGYYIVLWLVGILGWSHWRLRHARPADGVPFWGGMVLFHLVLYWFGSTSLAFYNPLGLYARHLTLLLPPLCLLAGVMLVAWWQRRDADRWPIMLWMIGSGLGLLYALHLLVYWKRDLLLLLVPVVIAGSQFWWPLSWRARPWMRQVPVGLLVVALVAMPMVGIRQGSVGPITWQNMATEVLAEIARVTGPVRIYSDTRTIDMLRVLSDLQVPDSRELLVGWRADAWPDLTRHDTRHLVLISSRDARNKNLSAVLAELPDASQPLWKRELSANERMYLFEMTSDEVTTHLPALFAALKKNS